MVGTSSPHAYSKELIHRGGSGDLLREIRRVDHECERSGVVPLYTLTHLCISARIPYEAARDVIFDHRSHYTPRKLAKRSGGGFRTIHAPSPQLKSLQRAILENCLPKRPASTSSYAFETGRNTAEAARQHVGARSMIHVDVADFFGSIPSKRIYSVFSALGYPELLSLEMALITSVGHEVTLLSPDEEGFTYEFLKEGYLPQGASTSGKLSNLICVDLDQRLRTIADRWGGVVTRYADDINFSTPFPLDRDKCSLIFFEIEDALRETGFGLNPRKTQVFPKVNEFTMLGLCVGQESIWLNRRYKSSIRAHLHGVEAYGISAHAISRNFDSDFEFMNFIWGHYAYCAGVDPKFARELSSRLELAGVRRI
jgi:RNA-directed DNA polymerase